MFRHVIKGIVKIYNNVQDTSIKMFIGEMGGEGKKERLCIFKMTRKKKNGRKFKQRIKKN